MSEHDYDDNVVDLPTQATDAEVSVLGAAMSGADIDELDTILDADDFYAPVRADAWAAICRVHAAGTRPDPVTVRAELERVRAKHDPLELLHWVDMTPVVASAGYYAQQVASAAGHRRLQEAGRKVGQLGASVGDLEDRREQARQTVDDACRGKAVSRARLLADLLPEAIDAAQHGSTPVLSTPWSDLDRTLGGLAPGRLVVFGARPGVGKSVVGTNLALHFADRHDHAVLLVSMEMPEREVTHRMMATYASVNLSRLQNADVDEPSWERINSHLGRMSALPVTVEDAPAQTVTAIRRAARNVQRSRDDLALIVVDYLQLVRAADTRAPRVEQLGQVSRDLKLLARETGACVVAMAQLNRASTQHSDGRPRLTDLRESGSIENDADQVVLMHRPDEELPEVEMNVDKNRHGPRGRTTLQMQGHYARLVSEWRP